MYIKAYWEYVAYSDKFRTIDIFSQFKAHYSGITQEKKHTSIFNLQFSKIYLHLLPLSLIEYYVFNKKKLALFQWAVILPQSHLSHRHCKI